MIGTDVCRLQLRTAHILFELSNVALQLPKILVIYSVGVLEVVVQVNQKVRENLVFYESVVVPGHVKVPKKNICLFLVPFCQSRESF